MVESLPRQGKPFLVLFCATFFATSFFLQVFLARDANSVFLDMRNLNLSTDVLSEVFNHLDLKGANQTKSSSDKPTFHVMHGLQGDDKGFIDEWEISLKTILVNAPVDADLHAHILTNNAAYRAVQNRINMAGLNGTIWRNQITISIYNVERYHANWTSFLASKLRGHNLDKRVKLGGYYRLFASQVLGPEIGPVAYMDTDTLILANLNDLHQYIDPTKMFQVSATWINSGFMIVNTEKFNGFWDLLDAVPEIDSGGDQTLVSLVAEAFPNVTGHLPEQWDTHLGHGFRRAPQTLLDKRDKVGMLHFTGSRAGAYFEGGFDYYCTRSNACGGNQGNLDKFRKSWALADYYVRLQWTWVKYFGQSMVDARHQGHALKLRLVE